MKKIVTMLITTSLVLGMFSGCAEKPSSAASSTPPIHICLNKISEILIQSKKRI